MQEVVTSFTTVMLWIILGLASIAVVLLLLSARQLQSHRGRALLGVGAMALLLVITVASQFLLAGHAPRSGASFQLLLPLVATLLMACLYVLTFPPLAPSRPTLAPRRHFCLLLLTVLAGIGTAGLVLLDLFAP